MSPELADAVAIALALDPRDRFKTANEMRRALHDGARGVEPRRTGEPTSATQATSVLPASQRRGRRAAAAAAPRTAAMPARQPRQGPPPRSRPAPAPPRRRARRGRLAGVLLGLFALALVVVAIVIATAPSTTRVVLRKVVYSDIHEASSALRQLIAENTR